MKKGFTMIELIFVIVIIGILAAVALPKLAATRDDAQVSKELMNAAIVLTDLNAAAVSQGTADINDTSAKLKCFTLTVTDVDGTIGINMLPGGEHNAQPYCETAQVQAEIKGLSGEHVIVVRGTLINH